MTHVFSDLKKEQKIIIDWILWKIYKWLSVHYRYNFHGKKIIISHLKISFWKYIYMHFLWFGCLDKKECFIVLQILKFHKALITSNLSRVSKDQASATSSPRASLSHPYNQDLKDLFHFIKKSQVFFTIVIFRSTTDFIK